jgi:hypothetical protein
MRFGSKRRSFSVSAAHTTFLRKSPLPLIYRIAPVMDSATLIALPLFQRSRPPCALAANSRGSFIDAPTGRAVYAKAKNVPEEKKGVGAGDVWTWTAIDADSKLILSYLCGGRDASWACQFMEDLASRVTTRIQITTDGHRAYAEAVEGAFGMDVDYAMLIKLYGSSGDSPDTRYSPAACLGTLTGILCGDPDRNHISTSYVERQNLNPANGRAALHAVNECLLQEV